MIWIKHEVEWLYDSRSVPFIPAKETHQNNQKYDLTSIDYSTSKLYPFLDLYDNDLNQRCSLFNYFDKVVSLDSKSWYSVTSIIKANNNMRKDREIMKSVVTEWWLRSKIDIILEFTHSTSWETKYLSMSTIGVLVIFYSSSGWD